MVYLVQLLWQKTQILKSIDILVMELDFDRRSSLSCPGSCNNINDPYAKICVPDVVKNLNVKVFNVKN